MLATRTKHDHTAFIQENAACAVGNLRKKGHTSTQFLWEQLSVPILVHSQKPSITIFVFVYVRWGSMRNWRALLGCGAIWQRDSAARWTEGSWQKREVVVGCRSVVRTAQKRTILHVRGHPPTVEFLENGRGAEGEKSVLGPKGATGHSASMSRGPFE